VNAAERNDDFLLPSGTACSFELAITETMHFSAHFMLEASAKDALGAAPFPMPTKTRDEGHN